MKTMSKKRVTEFCKLAIFWVVMGLSYNFTVRAPRCRPDGKHHNARKERGFKALNSIFLTGHRMSRHLVK